LTIVNPLITAGHLVKVQDETGDAIEFNPNTSNWINDIGTFDPDEGYKVRVNANENLTIDPALGGGLKSTKEQAPATFYRPAYIGNGLDHMNIYISGLTGGTSVLKPGDEIGIFDGSTCVGAGVITAAAKEFHSFVVSADDPTTREIDGFTGGNGISLRIWRPSTNREAVIPQPEFTAGSLKVYEPMGTSMIRISIADVGAGFGFETITSLGDIYPNPFRDEQSFYTSRKRHDLAIYNDLAKGYAHW
jgi:hypothetical protein